MRNNQMIKTQNLQTIFDVIESFKRIHPDDNRGTPDIFKLPDVVSERLKS